MVGIVLEVFDHPGAEQQDDACCKERSDAHGAKPPPTKPERERGDRTREQREPPLEEFTKLGARPEDAPHRGKERAQRAVD